MAKSGFLRKVAERHSSESDGKARLVSLRTKSREGLSRSSKRMPHRATASMPVLPYCPGELFPKWLLTRRDFQELSAQYSSLSSLNVWEICRQPAASRNKLHTKAVLDWIAQSPFLAEMKEYQLAEVCNRLTSVFFREGETLLHKGDLADCLYLLYEGHVGIYIEDDRLVDCVYPRNAVGEVGVQSKAIRTATVIAMAQVKALKLTLQDYDSVVYESKLQHIKSQTRFLLYNSFFSAWDRPKLNQISNALMVKSYSKGQVIYRPGEDSYDLFIVRSGFVTISAEATLEKTNIWPISPSQSQVSVVSRVYLRTIRKCRAGDFFGETELLEGSERTCIAQCTEDSLLYVIRKEAVEEILSEKDKAKLRSFYTARPPSAQIRKELEEDQALALTTKNALLDGISANLMPSTRGVQSKSLRKQFLAQIFITKHREMQKKQLVQQSKQTTIISNR